MQKKLVILLFGLVFLSCKNDEETKKKKTIFLTPERYSGYELGGISGADAKCNSATNKPKGQYKALLADGINRIACVNPYCNGTNDENKDWVFKPDTEYKRPDDTPIGKTQRVLAFFLDSLENPIVDDPNREIRYWSGLQSNYTSAEENCQGWSGSGHGATGNASSGTAQFGGISLFLNENIHPCNLQYPLVCVEQ